MTRGCPRFGWCFLLMLIVFVMCVPQLPPLCAASRTITDFRRASRRCAEADVHARSVHTNGHGPCTAESRRPSQVGRRPLGPGARLRTRAVAGLPPSRFRLPFDCHRSRWRRPSRRFAWRKMLGTAVTRRQCRMPAQRTSSGCGAAAARCSPAVPRCAVQASLESKWARDWLL